MMALETVLTLLVVVGVLLALLQASAQRALIQSPTPPAPGEFPPVSVLRPLKGVDPDLTENLRSLFRLAYREFEIILGTEEPDDPALVAAVRIAAEFSGALPLYYLRLEIEIIRGAADFDEAVGRICFPTGTRPVAS